MSGYRARQIGEAISGVPPTLTPKLLKELEEGYKIPFKNILDQFLQFKLFVLFYNFLVIIMVFSLGFTFDNFLEIIATFVMFLGINFFLFLFVSRDNKFCVGETGIFWPLIRGSSESYLFQKFSDIKFYSLKGNNIKVFAKFSNYTLRNLDQEDIMKIIKFFSKNNVKIIRN